LIQFAQKHVDTADQIGRYLEQDNLKQAQVLVHAIKGMAGNLGLGAVQESAGNLEAELKKRDSHSLKTLVLNFRHAVQNAVTELNKLKKEIVLHKNPGNDNSVDPVQFRKILSDLSPLIKNDFGAALQLAETLKNLSASSSINELVEKLLAHLEIFEEEQALEVLEELLDQ